MTKTTEKKTQTKKTSNYLTVRMRRLHALLHLPIKTVTIFFSSLEEMQAHMREEPRKEKKELTNISIEEESYDDDDDEKVSKTVTF